MSPMRFAGASLDAAITSAGIDAVVIRTPTEAWKEPFVRYSLHMTHAVDIRSLSYVRKI